MTLPARQPEPTSEPPEQPEPLWRDLTGRVLRRHRLERRERLAETAARAGISTQYLSEVERGRKDASSEVVAAVAGALDLSLLDLTLEVARDLHGGRRALGTVTSLAAVPVRTPRVSGPRVLALAA